VGDPPGLTRWRWYADRLLLGGAVVESPGRGEPEKLAQAGASRAPPSRTAMVSATRVEVSEAAGQGQRGQQVGALGGGPPAD
jgi:hypothetical protein